MTDDSSAATAEIYPIDASDRENEAPAPMEQPVEESQSPTHTPPKEMTPDSAQPASTEDLQPSLAPPVEIEEADAIHQSDNEEGEVELGPWEDLLGDGKVMKRIVKAGSGDVPELHSVCLVHYLGKHKGDGSVFVDTRTEKSGEPLSIVAGRELVKKNQGINIAVMRMAVGEVCDLEVVPEYGYGDMGSFSFPSVRGGATLVYRLELVAASPPADKRKGDMFFEERLEAAQRLRLQGNELFKNEDFEGALNRNKIGLDYTDDELLFQLQGKYLDDAHAVKAPLHLNSAACHLKLEDWTAAAAEASECLKLVAQCPGTEALEPKALFRRAKAFVGTGRTEDAMKDLQKAKDLRPRDTMVVQEIAKVRKQQKEQDAAVAKLFRNKLPPKPSGVSDSEGTMQADSTPLAADDTVSEPGGVLGLITSFFLAIAYAILAVFGITIPQEGRRNPQSASS